MPDVLFWGQLVSEEYAVRKTGVKPSTLARWARNGGIHRKHAGPKRWMYYKSELAVIEFMKKDPGFYKEAFTRMLALEERVQVLDRTVKALAALTHHRGIIFKASEELLLALYSIALNKKVYKDKMPDGELARNWASVIHWISTVDLERLTLMFPKDKRIYGRLFAFTEELALSMEATINQEFSFKNKLTHLLLCSGLESMRRSIWIIYHCCDPEGGDPDRRIVEMLSEEPKEEVDQLSEAELVREQYEREFLEPADAAANLIDISRRCREEAVRSSSMPGQKDPREP